MTLSGQLSAEITEFQTLGNLPKEGQESLILARSEDIETLNSEGIFTASSQLGARHSSYAGEFAEAGTFAGYRVLLNPDNDDDRIFIMAVGSDNLEARITQDLVDA